MTQNKINQLVINKLESLEVYEALKKKGLSDEEIYLLTPEGIKSALDAANKLPVVTAADNDKFLRVVNGTWAASTIPIAEEATFGV